MEAPSDSFSGLHGAGGGQGGVGDNEGRASGHPPTRKRPPTGGSTMKTTTTTTKEETKKHDDVQPVSLDPRKMFAIRSRSDSSGSTRGAFGPALKPLNDGVPSEPPQQQPEPPKSSPKNHRHHRKTKHHHKSSTSSPSDQAPPKNGNSSSKKQREGDNNQRDGPPAASSSSGTMSRTTTRASAVRGLSSAAQQEWIRGGSATGRGGAAEVGFEQPRMGQPPPPPPPTLPPASRSNVAPATPTSILKRGGKKKREPGHHQNAGTTPLYGISLLEASSAAPPLSGVEEAIDSRGTKKDANRGNRLQPPVSHTPFPPHPFAIREDEHDGDEDDDDGYDEYFLGGQSAANLRKPTQSSSSFLPAPPTSSKPERTGYDRMKGDGIETIRQPVPYSSRGEGRKSSGSANDPLRGSDILDNMDYDDEDDDLEGGAIPTSERSLEALQQPVAPASASVASHAMYGAVGEFSTGTNDSGNGQHNDMAMLAVLAMTDSQMPPGPSYPQQHHPLLSPPLQQQQQHLQHPHNGVTPPFYHSHGGPGQPEQPTEYSEDGFSSSQEAFSPETKARAKGPVFGLLSRVSTYLHPAHLFGTPPTPNVLSPRSPGEYGLEHADGDGDNEIRHVKPSHPRDGDGANDSQTPTGADWYYTAGGGRLVRKTLNKLLYDPEINEFTSLQQFSWAVLLGIFMGVFTAKWGQLIAYCVDTVWVAIPEMLLDWGVFTDLDGYFPLPHYMWICPAVMGGVLSCITVLLPKVPGQNEWIESLHRVGLMDHSTFWTVIALSTAGMASGLSLGPELPLVLTSGMVGSYLALVTHQSILSARVMNLTAASAAIGGFFGFPMAGALFVLEIPHRMGLQYVEALSPATIASIVAVLTNRMVTGDDLKGYFNYPFLTSTLPSRIFYAAVIYGLVGSVIGVVYANGCKKLKTWVHDWFHPHEHHGDGSDHHNHGDEKHNDSSGNNADSGRPSSQEEKSAQAETVPLVDRRGKHAQPQDEGPAKRRGWCHRVLDRIAKATEISNKPLRAALVGFFAGLLNGLICMFVPHNLFWGEEQTQTMIDRGLTPLPVLGHGDARTADMTAYGYCLIDYEDDISVARGITTECLALIAASKVLTIGLSLGTGIVGGHFWGPLFVGAASAHLFTDLMTLLSRYVGVGGSLTTYPCVALLCIMGSAHVVTFRAHTAIMLILTLTISAFSPEVGASGEDQSSDYSAVFPLLVVSCFVSLMVTRSTVFYKEQRCRGDILASPQVLCEPRKEDEPDEPENVIHGGPYNEYGEEYDDGEDEDDFYESSDWEDQLDTKSEGTSSFGTLSGGGGIPEEEKSPDRSAAAKTVITDTTQNDIELEFQERYSELRSATPTRNNNNSIEGNSPQERGGGAVAETLSSGGETTLTDPSAAAATVPLPSNLLDDLLAAVPFPQRMPHVKGSKRGHQRHKSTPDALVNASNVAGFALGALPSSSTPSNRTSGDPVLTPRSHRRTASVEAISYFRIRADNGSTTPRSVTPTKGIHRRGQSYGEIDFQPALLEQARARASSSASTRAINSQQQQQQQQQQSLSPALASSLLQRPRHNRSHSSSSALALTSVGLTPYESAGALSQDDLERSFNAVFNHMALSRGSTVPRFS